MKSFLAELVKLEMSLRREASAVAVIPFRVCPCGRQGRLHDKCTVCLLDDMKALVKDECLKLPPS